MCPSRLCDQADRQGPGLLVHNQIYDQRGHGTQNRTQTAAQRQSTHEVVVTIARISQNGASASQNLTQSHAEGFSEQPRIRDQAA